MQVIYLAFGYAFLVMAVHSARTAREAGTEADFKLITNVPLKSLVLDNFEPFDQIVIVDTNDHDNRYHKVRVFEYADSQKTMFIDSDTEIRAPLDQLLPILDNFDLAARPNIIPSPKRFLLLSDHDCQKMGLGTINTGVLLFSKSVRARKLFSSWKENYATMNWGQDQPSFFRSFSESQARFFPLSIAWNARANAADERRYIKSEPDAIRILHYKDPMQWPAVGPALAAVHENVRIEWAARSSAVDEQMRGFGKFARAYRSRIFRNGLVPRLFNRIGVSRKLRLPDAKPTAPK